MAVCRSTEDVEALPRIGSLEKAGRGLFMFHLRRFRGSIRHVRAEEGDYRDQLERDPQRLGVGRSLKNPQKYLWEEKACFKEKTDARSRKIPGCETPAPPSLTTSTWARSKLTVKGGAEVLKEVKGKRNVSGPYFLKVAGLQWTNPARGGEPSPSCAFRVYYYYYCTSCNILITGLTVTRGPFVTLK